MNGSNHYWLWLFVEGETELAHYYQGQVMWTILPLILNNGTSLVYLFAVLLDYTLMTDLALGSQGR